MFNEDTAKAFSDCWLISGTVKLINIKGKPIHTNIIQAYTPTPSSGHEEIHKKYKGFYCELKRQTAKQHQKK